MLLASLGPVAGVGALGTSILISKTLFTFTSGALGIAGTRMACLGPFFCVALDGKCCALDYNVNGADVLILVKIDFIVK